MIKEIIKAIFGSVGKIILDLIFVWLFYVSPGGPGFANMDGDSQGWGSLFYITEYIPLVVCIFFIYSLIFLKRVGVPGKHILGFLSLYLVIMVIVEIMSIYNLDPSVMATIVGVMTLVINILFLIALHFMKTKYGHSQVLQVKKEQH